MPNHPVSPHFLVIVPGYMGSKLRERRNQELVWLDLSLLLKNPLKIEKAIDGFLEKLAYPNDDLEPAGLMDQLLIVPPLFKQEHYGRLVDQLIDWGYELNPMNPQPNRLAVYAFSYDWRQDNRISARQLGEAIERWKSVNPGAKAWIIAHSNGGIVSRWYIQKEGGVNHVERLFLMGSPWDGAPKALKVLLDGLDVFGLVKLNRYDLGHRLGKVIRSFPSFYQLLPVQNPFLRDEMNQPIDLFEDTSWLENKSYTPLLIDAQKFNQEIALDPQVKTICFYGNRKSTTSAALTRKNDQGQFFDIQWIETHWGDGTVPVWSSCHPWFSDNKETCWKQFPVSHGDIYIDGRVLACLYQEAFGVSIDKYRGLLTAPNFDILFETDKDFYVPGEDVEIWLDLKNSNTGEPLAGMNASFWIVRDQDLPGAEKKLEVFHETLPERLLESEKIPGHYSNSIKAPLAEGHYRVSLEVRPLNNPPILMEEPIVVERI